MSLWTSPLVFTTTHLDLDRLTLPVPCMKHLAELEGRKLVGGKLRHRGANPRCTFCALECHSPTPASSLEKPVGIRLAYLQELRKRSKLDRRSGGDRLVPAMGWLLGTDAAAM